MKPFHVADPCTAAWDSMARADQSRFCGSCEKRVFDLATLTERQLAGLSLVSGGRFCGRQTIRQGELVLRAPPPPPPRAPSRLFGPIRAAAVAGALSLAACGQAHGTPPMPVPALTGSPVTSAAGEDEAPETRPSEPPEERFILGDIAVPALPQRIDFASRSARLDALARDVLAAAADFLRTEPESVRVAIEGHVSEAEAKTRAGKNLARARAEAVKKALVDLGIPAGRLYVMDTGARAGQRAELRLCSETEPCADT